MNIIAIGILGLCFGSFVNALVWRIKHKRDFVRERSECTHCHHVLAWYDLLPIVSWMLLRGKCRYCHKAIEDSPFIEVLVAGLFIISYITWPYLWTGVSMVLFGLWLISLVLLTALAVYDARWYILPDKLVWPLVVLGIFIAGTRWIGVENLTIDKALLQIVGGITIISGLYYGLYVLSKGTWVGFGDIKLGLFIGLTLGWQQSLLALFLANFIGLIVVLPGMLSKKLTPKSKVPFGPFLIVACILAFLYSKPMIDWYIKTLLGL